MPNDDIVPDDEQNVIAMHHARVCAVVLRLHLIHQQVRPDYVVNVIPG